MQKAVRVFLESLKLQDIVLKAHKMAKTGKMLELVEVIDDTRKMGLGDLKKIRNRYDNNKTLLHSAAASNSLDIVGLLCSDKQDVFQVDNNGNSPFHTAAQHSSFAVMKYLTDTALNGVYHDEEDEAVVGGKGPKMVRRSKLIR